MTTSVPHVMTMTMQYTCAGHPNRQLNRVLQYVYIVAAQNTVCHNATIGHGVIENNHIIHWKPLGTRNFNVPMAKFRGTTMEMQASDHQTLKDRPVNCIHRDHTAKFWEVPVLTNQTIMIVISFLGETRTTAVTREEIQLQVLVNTPLDSSSKIIMLIILVQILGIMGTSQEDQHSPMLGLMRDITSSTLHPYTHLHLH